MTGLGAVTLLYVVRTADGRYMHRTATPEGHFGPSVFDAARFYTEGETQKWIDAMMAAGLGIECTVAQLCGEAFDHSEFGWRSCSNIAGTCRTPSGTVEHHDWIDETRMVTWMSPGWMYQLPRHSTPISGPVYAHIGQRLHDQIKHIGEYVDLGGDSSSLTIDGNVPVKLIVDTVLAAIEEARP